MTTVDLKTIQHRIGGAETPGGSTRTAPIWDPATGEQQAQVLLAEAADVDAAVQAARAAFETWKDVSVVRRMRIMFAFRNLVERHADDLARIVASEHGKVVADAKGEVIRGMEVAEYACGLPQISKGEYSDQVSTDVDSFSFRQPLGVCAGITPFNFPVMVPMWMHPMAIATGNTFVLKPSERDPSASNFIAELYAEAGLPDGVFNVVHGDKVAVDAILAHPDIEASASGKRVQALGGAKNHAVVMPDADLDFAAEQLTAAGFGSAGQRCMAIAVAVAVGDAAEPLLERLKAKAEAIKVGPGLEPDSDMGPVVTEQARERIVGYIDGTTADVVVDGRALEIDGGGFFVGPTLLDRVTPDMDAYRDEIFGPVLSVVRVDTLDEAVLGAEVLLAEIHVVDAQGAMGLRKVAQAGIGGIAARPEILDRHAMLAQVIVAVAKRFPEKSVRSVHAVFARAVVVGPPVEFDIDVVAEGRSTATAVVSVTQGGRRAITPGSSMRRAEASC